MKVLFKTFRMYIKDFYICKRTNLYGLRTRLKETRKIVQHLTINSLLYSLDIILNMSGK